MFKNLSPGAIGIRRISIQESIKLARETGFAGIDFNIRDAAALARVQSVDAVRGLFDESGIRPGQWGLPVAWRQDDQWEADLDHLPAFAKLGQVLGCTRTCTVMPSFSDERPYQENFTWHVKRLRLIAEILREFDCRLGIEFIGPKTLRIGHPYEFIYTLDGLMELTRAIGTGNVGALLDSYHLYTSGGTIEDLARIDAKDVVVVHVNDALAGVPRDEQLDLVRALPMETGVINLRAFMCKLQSLDYDGPVTPEPFSERVMDIAASDPLGAARIAAQAMDALWTAASLG